MKFLRPSLFLLGLGLAGPASAYMEGQVRQIQGHCVVVRVGPGLSFLSVQGEEVPADGDLVVGPLMELGSSEFQVEDVGFQFEAVVARAGASKSEIDDWFSEEGCDYEDEYATRPDSPEEEESDWDGGDDGWDSDEDLDAPWLDEDEDQFGVEDEWEDEDSDNCGEESDGFDNDFETDQDCLEDEEDVEEGDPGEFEEDSDFPDSDDFGIDG